MTSQTRQDAREKAGILKGSNHGDGYGTSTTLRHVQFDADGKETHRTDETQNSDALIGWDDLSEFDSALLPVDTRNVVS